MEVLVRNAEGNLSAADREYADKKLGRLDRFFNSAQRVEIVHREVKASHRIEITVFADGYTLRGEETDASVKAAIDKVAEKMDIRLRRLKTRLIKSHHRRGVAVPSALEQVEVEAPEVGFVLKERKRFLLKPMSTEEASLQMELLGHPFFVYRNEVNNATEVLYKRADGAYGLLSPQA